MQTYVLFLLTMLNVRALDSNDRSNSLVAVTLNHLPLLHIGRRELFLVMAGIWKRQYIKEADVLAIT